MNRGDTLRAMDADFLREANMGNLKEIELGRLAIRQGASDRVRTFGQQMVTDHGRMNEELKNIARQKNLNIPDSLMSDKQADISKFQQLSGAEFDREFIRQMVTDHQKDVEQFDREARTGDDAAVRSLASRSLPTIRHHLEMARDLDQNMGSPTFNPTFRNNNPGGNGNMNNPNFPNQNPGNQNPGNQNPSVPDSSSPSLPNSPSSPSTPPTSPGSPTQPR
jgi:putative membrane protein